MAHDFYPLVKQETPLVVEYPARIAVYDDAAAAPRVVEVEPQEIRAYLDEITQEVNRLSHEQGGTIPFMVVREIVENFIHASFISPIISILDGGNTLRFSDQGPGIGEKELALQYGTTSATEEMKLYIRGVGSGLPYVQQYMADKGGSLTIEDNIGAGTVVTLSTKSAKDAQVKPVIAPEVEEVPAAGPAISYQVNERAALILKFLKTHEQVGSGDLTEEYGLSAPTWSRELKALAEAGIIKKSRQKYLLTAMGQKLLA